MSLVTRGLTKIEYAQILSDGSTGTTWATLGYTAEGTAKLVEEDGTTTDFMAEESDTPIDSYTTTGKTKLNFSVIDPDTTTLEKALGGSVVSTTWNRASTKPSIEYSWKVTTAKGLITTIPRGKVVGKLNSEFSKKNVFMIDIEVTVLTPTKSGLADISMTPA